MKLFLQILLAIAAVLCFAVGLVMNNILWLSSSIMLAAAAYFAERRRQQYFELAEFRP